MVKGELRLKIVIKVAEKGQVRTIEDTGSRWVGLLRPDTYGGLRLQGEDGRVYAFMLGDGNWWHPETGGLVLSFDVFDN